MINGNLIRVTKEAFELNEQETKAFDDKLQDTIDRAEKVRKEVLRSGLPQRDAIKIAHEIFCLVDDLNELSNRIIYSYRKGHGAAMVYNWK